MDRPLPWFSMGRQSCRDGTIVPKWHLVNDLLTIVPRGGPGRRETGTAVEAVPGKEDVEGRMQLPFLSNRKSYDDAAELIARFGDNAGYEAAARADRSRDLGNHVRFCHWRQIERLIVLLSVDQPLGTIH